MEDILRGSRAAGAEKFLEHLGLPQTIPSIVASVQKRQIEDPSAAQSLCIAQLVLFCTVVVESDPKNTPP